MTLSLSKLMASDAPLTDDERKRLLAIAKAALEYRDSYDDPDRYATADAFTHLVESMDEVEP